jgi:hypothetical protein
VDERGPSIWSAPSDLEGLLKPLAAKLLQRYSFLSGFGKAKYDGEFFHQTLGLNISGMSVNKVTAKMCPPTLWEPDWKLNGLASRVKEEERWSYQHQ